MLLHPRLMRPLKLLFSQLKKPVNMRKIDSSIYNLPDGLSRATEQSRTQSAKFYEFSAEILLTKSQQSRHRGPVKDAFNEENCKIWKGGVHQWDRSRVRREYRGPARQCRGDQVCPTHPSTWKTEPSCNTEQDQSSIGCHPELAWSWL